MKHTVNINASIVSNLAVVKQISDPYIYNFDFIKSNLTNASFFVQDTIDKLNSLKKKDEGEMVYLH